MSRNGRLDRRSVVKAVGSLTVAGLLAGCSGGDGGSGGDGEDGGSGGDATEEPTDTTTASDGGSDGGSGGQFDGFLDETDNYDGTVVDETGSDEVVIDVGTEANGGNYGFAPPAVRVSTGTTVVWQWTGEGQQHNVVAQEGGDFESELSSEEGFTFEHTFEEATTAKYVCQPHESLGMKGVVVAE